MKKLSVVLLVLVTMNLQAQDNLSYGIKAGLELSTLLGDKETNSQGENLEKNGYVTGFHVGAVFNIDIIEDKFGVAPEFLFTQRGGRYLYEGPGSLTLTAANGNPITFQGEKRDALSIVNSYVTIPVMLYYKPVKRVRISAGMDVGFLVASTGSGESKFTWMSGRGRGSYNDSFGL